MPSPPAGPSPSLSPVAQQPSPIVGILGGMGPAATADFYAKLIAETPAETEAEHLRVVMWADPTVPDRIAGWTGQGQDPTPALAAGLQTLQSAGAALVAMPCNTAHAFLPALRAAAEVPILDMIELTVGQVAVDAPRVRRIGVLATAGTLHAGLYQHAAGKRDLQVLVPDPEMQPTVLAAIAEVKSGRAHWPSARSRLHRAIAHLTDRGAEAIVAGCTEIGAVLEPAEAGSIPGGPAVIDAGRVLARATVSAAGKRPVGRD